MHTAEMERAPQGIQTHKIPVPASFTEGKAAVEPKRVRKLELETEEKLDIEQTSTSTTAHMHTAEMERTPQGRQTHGITTSFTDGKEPKHLGKPQLDPEGKLDKEQTSTSTPAHIQAQKRKRTSQEKQTNGIPASFTEGKAPSKLKCVRRLQLDHEGSLDQEQTSTSTPACMHGRKTERTSQGRPTHTITEGEAPVEPNRQGEIHFYQLDRVGSRDEEQTSTSTTAHTHTTEMEKTTQERPTHKIPSSITEGKGKPFVNECHEKIGTERGRDQLPSFRFAVLQIPPGGIEVSVRCLNDSLTNQHKLTKQETSKASSSSSGNTNWQCQAVTNQQIVMLAQLLHCDDYTKLCRELGIEDSCSCWILQQRQWHYETAYTDVLLEWKRKTGGPEEHLHNALYSCGLGRLIRKYKE